MKTVTIPVDNDGVNGLLRQAEAEDLLVRSSDGSEYLLTPVDDFGVEVALTRANRQIMEFLDERRRQTETIPWDEVKRQLGLCD